jgi:dihydroorotase
MLGNLLIKNGRILDPGCDIDITGDLLVVKGKIKQVGGICEDSKYNDLTILDASGLIVCPGFIDMHCHLREPGYEDKETIATGTKAAAAGGFSTVCCMPNTKPPLDNKSQVDYVTRMAMNEGAVKVLVIGCVTKGRQGEELTEMYELADAGVIGFSDDGDPVKSTGIMLMAMEYSASLGLFITDHCEDKELTDDGQINDGWVATRMGLKGIPAAAEEIIVARDLALAKLTGTRIHIAHVSTEGSVDIIRRAKDEGVKVTAEVTPHHLILTDEMVIGGNTGNNLLEPYDTNTKVNPPLRTPKDITALIKGLRDGVIDVIATDHAPHTIIDKNCEYGVAAFGISGFETAFGSLMSLVHNGHLDLKTLIMKLTSIPANVIGNKCENTGIFKVGCQGDIVIFNPDMEWEVECNKFYSKGKNNPLNGYRLKGKVMATAVDGTIAYRDVKLPFND